MQAHNESHANSSKRVKIAPNFNIVGRYTGVLFAGFLESKSGGGSGRGSRGSMSNTGTGGLVVVERPWLDIAQNLGGVFERHKFGE